MSENQRRLYWIIITLAVVLSLISVAHRLHSSPQLADDELDYQRLGVSLSGSHTYECLIRAPAYPFFIAIIYSITGPSVPVVLIAQVLLFACTLLIVYRIAYFITGSINISLLTIGLCALWLPFIRSVSLLLTETLAGFLTAAMLWMILLVIDKPKLSWAVFTGVLIGINALTKAVMLPFIFLVPLLFIIGNKDRMRRLALAGVILFAATATMVPWTVRNYRVTGCFVPVSLLSGLNLWYGNYPKTYLVKEQKEVIPEYGYTNDRRAVEKDRKFMRDGIALIKENPARSLRFAALKFSALWFGNLGKNPISISGRIPHIGSFGIPKMAFVQTPLFILAIIGWFKLPILSKRRAYPIITMFVLCTVGYVALFADPRYSLPMEFYKIMFAASAMEYFYTKSAKPAK